MKAIIYVTTIIILVLAIIVGSAYQIGIKEGTLSQVKTEKEELEERCNIPQSYCNDSVKGVEQALKDCFTVNDRLIEINGKDLVKELHECNTKEQMLMGFLNGCANDIKICVEIGEKSEEKLKTCVNDLNMCSEDLMDCILND